MAASRTSQSALLASTPARTLFTTPARFAEGEDDAAAKKKALKDSLKTFDQVKAKVEKVCKEFEKINQEKFSLNVCIFFAFHSIKLIDYCLNYTVNTQWLIAITY